MWRRSTVHPDAAGAVATDPERSGWRYLSFRAFGLGEGESRDPRPSRAGSGHRHDLGRRRRARVRPGARASRSTAGRRSSRGCRGARTCRPARSPGSSAAHCRAAGPWSRSPRHRRAAGPASPTEPILVGPDDVEIEIRGAGNATRQVNNIMMPDFPADRLLICEVFTPERQLVGLAAAQARYRRSAPRGGPRGDLLLPDQPARGLGHPARLPPRRVARPGPARPPWRPAQRRPGLSPVRLDAGLRRLLPERPGRRPPDDGQHRRSRPGLGPDAVAIDGARSAPAARASVTPADRRAGAGSLRALADPVASSPGWRSTIATASGGCVPRSRRPDTVTTPRA